MNIDDFPPPPMAIGQWPAWLAIAFGWTLARWPWWLVRRVGPMLGLLMRVLMRQRRGIVRHNLALCFPELATAEREAMLRASFASLGISVFEFLRAWWGPLAPADQRYTLAVIEHLQAARQGGRGIMLVSAHFTTLELCGRMLTRDIPLAGMYRPHDSAALEWAVKRGRARYTEAMFARDELRPALRHLKKGGVLWFAPDQETRRGDSVVVPFFGQAASTLTSTHQLARLTGAAVLAFFHERLDDGSYRIEILPALENFPSADATNDTARVMAMLESLIRRAPTQYLWLHDRFKQRSSPAAEIAVSASHEKDGSGN